MTRAQLAPELAFRDAPDRNCLNRHDLDWFPGQTGKRDTTTLAAICNTCPHLEPCRNWAIRHEAYGYWAGTTPQARKRERRRLGITLEQPQAHPGGHEPVCGTEAGYNAHRRHNEPACADCRHAHAERVADYKRRRAA